MKIISSNEPDLKKNYKAERRFINITRYNYLKGFYKTLDREIYSDGHKVPVRVYPNKDAEFLMIFFHGGGWVTGSIDSYDRVCSNLAKLTGSIVLSVDYRLAPEHKFPAGLNDCYNAAKEIFAHSGIFGPDTGNIILIGDSAGANLAAAVSLMARDSGEFSVKKQILIYPAVANDHSPSSPFSSVHENGEDYILTSKKVEDYMTLYMRDESDRHNPYFAPLEAEDLSNQPDTLILTAEYDPLRDEGEYFGKRLGQAGNKVRTYRIKGVIHGYFALPKGLSPVSESYSLINKFIREHRT